MKKFLLLFSLILTINYGLYIQQTEIWDGDSIFVEEDDGCFEWHSFGFNSDVI